jgi:hypothetical protein
MSILSASIAEAFGPEEFELLFPGTGVAAPDADPGDDSLCP